jgi:hypothetical protein
MRGYPDSDRLSEADYLREYINFIKIFKHLDIYTGQVSVNESQPDFANKIYDILTYGYPFQANEKIRIKLEKLLFKTKRLDLIFNYFKKYNYYFKVLRDKYKTPEINEKDWEEFEKLICNNANYSLIYAKLIENKFELGEHAIAEDAQLSIEYAKIIKNRFILGELIISQKNKYLLEYAKIIGRLPEELYNRMLLNSMKTKEN